MRIAHPRRAGLLAFLLLYSEYLPARKHGTMHTFSRRSEPLRETCTEACRRHYGGPSQHSILFGEFGVFGRHSPARRRISCGSSSLPFLLWVGSSWPAKI